MSLHPVAVTQGDQDFTCSRSRFGGRQPALQVKVNVAENRQDRSPSCNIGRVVHVALGLGMAWE